LKYLIEHADQKSLAIIDEPGMGTDPDEGASLAMAVIDHLSHQDTYVAVSTHLNRLKTYGLLNQRAVNASVEFDTEKHCPTFELRYGSPGISHGLEMARKMGVPFSILAKAEEYLDQDEIRLNRLIEKLNCLMKEANKEKEAAENVKRKYNAAKRKIKERVTALETEKRALIEQKRIEAETAIREARQELKEAINLLKRKEKPSQAYVTERHMEVSRRLLDYLGPKNDDEPCAESKEIERGQWVYHKRLEQEGIVQSVDPSGLRARVLLGNVKISAEFQDLEVVKGGRESHSDKRPETVSWDLKGGLTKELNVIGCRVDEAIPLIDKTIDRALVDGELTLKIIHGFGTGRLREAIRAHLKGLPYVKKIHSADLRSGGDAITIVELF
jgi:DNA mismatch repair protein MutS2